MVTVYTKTGCLASGATVNHFLRLGVSVVEINVDKNEQAANLLWDGGFTGVPVVMADGGDTWTGFHPDLIEKMAAQLKAA